MKTRSLVLSALLLALVAAGLMLARPGQRARTPETAAASAKPGLAPLEVLTADDPPVFPDEEEVTPEMLRAIAEHKGRPATAPPPIDPTWVAPKEPRELRERPELRKAVDELTQVRQAQIKQKGDVFGYNSSAYAATFAPTGVDFAHPIYLPNEEVPRLSLNLDAVTCGADVLARGAACTPTVDAEQRTLIYDRGGVQERYVLGAEAIEQLFVISSLPVRRGALTVRVGVQTPETPPAAGASARSLAFTRGGARTFTISNALVYDAAGRRLELDLTYDGGGYTMTVPADWVATASLPITVDPLVGGVFNIDATSTNNYLRPSDVAYNSSANEWLVVWNEAFGASTFDFDVLGQRVTSAGALTGAVILIEFSVQQGAEAAVAWSDAANNQYLVAWRHDPVNNAPNVFTDNLINARRVSGAGALLAAAFLVINSADQEARPDVAWGTASWLIVWDHVFSSAGPDVDVNARSCTVTQVLGATFNFDFEVDWAWRPAVAYNAANGTFLCVWEKTTPAFNIAGRIGTTTGTTTAIFIIDENGGANRYPDCAAGGTEWLATWYFEFSATDWDIYARRVNSTGGFPAGTIFVEIDTANQRFAKTTFSTITSEWFVVWDDSVSGAVDIYGNRISSTGAILGGSGYQISSAAAMERWPAVSPPNSTNVVLVTWLNGPAPGPFTLQAQRFSLDYIAPPVPTATAPTGTICTASPTLTWTAVVDTGGSGLNYYEWQVSTSPTFVPLTASGTTTATSVVWGPATPGVTYYWHVRAVDNVLNMSAYSATLSFTLDGIPPPTPTLLAPPSGVWTTDNTPTFDWSDVTDICGVTYQIQVDLSPADWIGNAVDVSGIVPSTYTSGVLADGTYQWRVRAIDGAGNLGAWSAVFTLPLDSVAPPAPALTSPPDTSCTVDTTPTLTWGAVTDPAPGSGIANYEWQVDDSPAFTAPITQSGTTAATSVTTAALASGTWFWHVRAIDVAGNIGAWSTTWSFTVDLTPPGAPTLVSPTGGVCTNDTTPTFDWSDVIDPCGVTYQIQVDASPADWVGNAINVSGIIPSTYTPVPALAAGTWQWRVQATDGVGNIGAWSATGTFTVDITPPAAPTNLAPANGACTADSTPTFDWTDVTDPCGVTYDLQADDSGAGFPSPEISVTGLAASTFTPVGPLIDGTYSWRARAVDGAGNAGPWSTVWTTIVDTTPPPVPTLLTPPNGTCTTDNTPTFDWSDVVDGCGVTYEIQADNSGVAFPSPEVNVTALAVSTYTSGTLADGSYSWRVRAVDSVGNASAWSTVWTLNIVTVAPAAPTLLTPANASCTNDTTPTFDWTDVTDPCGVTYQIQVDNSGGGFPSPEVDVSGIVPSTFTSGVLADATYSWRVRATNGAGMIGAWSTTWTITIDTVAPAAPTNLLPANGACLADSTPTFDWTDVTDPCGVTYEMQADNSGAAFPSPEISVTALATSTFTPAVPLIDGTYSWRARAVDGAGNAGPWSTVWTTIVDTTPPPVPTLLAPPDASCTLDTTPTFDWSDVADGCGVTYEIQADNSGAAFPSPEINVTALAVSTFTPATALADGTYSWRVRAVDGVGNASAWSTVWTIIIDTTAPAAPTLLTPADASCTNDTTPTFDWSDVADPCGVTYQIQVDNSGSGFPSPEADVSGIVASTYTTGVLADGTYSWRVRATDGVGNIGPWSTVWTVIIDTVAPAAPTNLLPANGVCTNDTTPTFDWTDVTDPCGVTYEMQADNSGAAFPSPEISVTALATSTFTPAVALADGTYSWRARAVDGAGNASAWSTVWTVIIDTVAPAAPAPLAPPNASFTLDNTPTFDWSDVVDPCGLTYEIQVDNSGLAFPSPEISTAGLVPSTFTPATALADGEYWWRVRATDSAGNVGPWSVVWTVTVDTTPPPNPTALQQYYIPGVTVLPWGGGTVDTSVVLEANITEIPSNNTVRLHVEVVPALAAYTGTADATSLFVASGTTVQLTVGGLVDGNYKWRVWSEDSLGQVSGFVEFTGAVGTDFTVDVNDPPNPPSMLSQFQLNGTTVIAVGGTTTETGVVLKAMVSDPEGNTVRARFEVKPAGVAFDGAGLVDGTWVSSGGTSEATVSVALGSFHWRAITQDIGLLSSAFVNFGGNPEPAGVDFIRAASAANADPNPPTAINQFFTDGITIIALGGTTTEPAVQFQGGVSDSDGNPCALQVEVKPAGTPFDGAGLAIGAFVASGSTASVTVPVAAGSFHWRARTVDSIGAFSTWVAFGGNPEPDGIDFNAAPAPNLPPGNPTALNQFRLDGVTVIAVGGSTNELGVILRGTVTDPNPGNGIALQVEVKPVGVPFVNVPSATGGFVGSGGTASVTFMGLTLTTSYHWQARAVDTFGALSGWVSFGGNADAPIPAATDFTVSAVNATPSASGPDQRRSNGVTSIPPGGSTNETTVIFQATVTDGDSSSVRLDVEVVPNASAFTGTPTASSANVPSGSTPQITVSGFTVGTSYKWRFRSTDTGGASSAWTDFAAGDPDFTVVPNSAPAAPAGLEQRRLNGVTVIALGGQTGQNGYRMFATVTDVDAFDTVRLQAEVKPSATPFDGLGLISGPLVANGSLADVMSPLVALGFYHWRVRAVDQIGLPGPWVEFSLATPNHIEKIPPSPPVLSNVGQFRTDNVTGIPVGADTNQTRVLASATVDDLDDDNVQWEVEVQPVGVAFVGVATHVTGFFAPGSNLAAILGLPEASYHWQYRAIDQQGLSTPWTVYGGNPEPTGVDFRIWYGGNTGHESGCNSSVPGAGRGGLALWAALVALLVTAALRRR